MPEETLSQTEPKASREAALSRRLDMGLETYRQGRFDFAEGIYAQILIQDPDNAEALYMRFLCAALQPQPQGVDYSRWLASLPRFLRENKTLAARKRILTDANQIIELAGNCIVAQAQRHGLADDQALTNYITQLLALGEMAQSLITDCSLATCAQDPEGKWEFLRFLHNALTACNNVLWQQGRITARQSDRAQTMAEQFTAWKDAAKDAAPVSSKKPWWKRP